MERSSSTNRIGTFILILWLTFSHFNFYLLKCNPRNGVDVNTFLLMKKNGTLSKLFCILELWVSHSVSPYLHHSCYIPPYVRFSESMRASLMSTHIHASFICVFVNPRLRQWIYITLDTLTISLNLNQVVHISLITHGLASNM